MKRENDCHANLFLSGIYFLYNRDKLVYVGQSDCIIRRIGEHFADKEFDNFKYISEETFYWLYEYPFRKYFERKLIKFFNPKYNKEKIVSVYRVGFSEETRKLECAGERVLTRAM